MTRSFGFCLATGAVLVLGALAGCDERLAMQPARDHGATELASAPQAFVQPSQDRGERSAPRERTPRAERVSAPVRLVQGKPLWAENRNHTAEENAQYQFEHHGSELAARDLDDFVGKVHRFVGSPPDGALTRTRANGDTLMYDPKSKLFAVVRSDGAPRTVFKPETGKTYWDEQVAQERSGSSRPASSRTRRDREDS